ncbi:hypothetical protein AB5I41_16645 [Sphingomonas sp. MMS24-JH45]
MHTYPEATTTAHPPTFSIERSGESELARPPSKPSPDRRSLANAIVGLSVDRIGKDERAARSHDWLAATILTVRNEIIVAADGIDQGRACRRGEAGVDHLSLEFLIGRLLRDALSNLQKTGEIAAALAELGVDLAEIEEIEPDAALGNGGRAGSRPASWKASRRWTCPPTATASAT